MGEEVEVTHRGEVCGGGRDFTHVHDTFRGPIRSVLIE